MEVLEQAAKSHDPEGEGQIIPWGGPYENEELDQADGITIASALVT